MFFFSLQVQLQLEEGGLRLERIAAIGGLRLLLLGADRLPSVLLEPLEERGAFRLAGYAGLLRDRDVLRVLELGRDRLFGIGLLELWVRPLARFLLLLKSPSARGHVASRQRVLLFSSSLSSSFPSSDGAGACGPPS